MTGVWKGRRARDHAFDAHRNGGQPTVAAVVVPADAVEDLETMRGVELLHEFLGSRTRRPGMLLSEQIRRAAHVGDPLARQIVRDGVLGGLDELASRGTKPC